MKSPTKENRRQHPLRVCMVLNDRELTDYRVINEAKTLAEQGYEVTVLMPALAAASQTIYREGFRILSVPVANPSNRTFIKLTFVSSWEKALELLGIQYERQIASDPGIQSSSLNPEEEVASHLASISPETSQLAPTGGSNLKGLVRSLITAFNVIMRHLIKITLKVLRLQGRIEQIVWLRTEVAFAHFLQKLQPDIIHAHDLPDLRISCHLSEKMGCKLVYDAHEFYSAQGGLPKAAARFWRKREKEDVRTPNLVITVNECIAGLFQDAYSIPAPHVIHNTSNYVNHLDRRSESRKLLLDRYGKAPEQSCIMLYLGWLHTQRGLPELIDALATLPEQYLLTIMGDGPERENIHRQVTQLQLQHRVNFWGVASREEIPLLAVGADIGLVTQHPTGLNEINCSPNRLSDYLMAGLPLAMSDLPFLRLFAEKYKCAELFDSRDPQSIAKAIQGMYDDREKFEALRRNSVAAGKEFNWDIETSNNLLRHQYLYLYP